MYSNCCYSSKPAVQAPASGRKGMVLGKKTKDSELVEAIKTEEGVNEYHAPSQPDQTGPSSGYASADRRRSSASSSATQEGVHITVEEKISVTANRDGGLQNMEVKGDMVLKVTDPNSALIKVTMGMSGDSNIQYKVYIRPCDRVYIVDASECRQGCIQEFNYSAPRSFASIPAESGSGIAEMALCYKR